MVDWGRLEHAYGAATDMPALLHRIASDDDPELWWGELYSRLCNRGGVAYSASFAALPALADAADRLGPGRRHGALCLAAAILACDKVQGPRDEFLSPVMSAIPRLRGLALESLGEAGLSRDDFVDLLQALLALEGDSLWGKCLEGLVDGEFSGACPHCAAGLHLVIGEGGFFAAAGEWAGGKKVSRRPIWAARGELPEACRLMRERALSAGQPEVALWVKYLFGVGGCPKCEQSFAVPEAIASGYSGPPPEADSG